MRCGFTAMVSVLLSLSWATVAFAQPAALDLEPGLRFTAELQLEHDDRISEDAKVRAHSPVLLWCPIAFQVLARPVGGGTRLRGLVEAGRLRSGASETAMKWAGATVELELDASGTPTGKPVVSAPENVTQPLQTLVREALAMLAPGYPGTKQVRWSATHALGVADDADVELGRRVQASRHQAGVVLHIRGEARLATRGSLAEVTGEGPIEGRLVVDGRTGLWREGEVKYTLEGQARAQGKVVQQTLRRRATIRLWLDRSAEVVALVERGELNAARAAVVEWLKELAQRRGESHPDVGTALQYKADVERQLGRPRAARGALEQALAIYRAAVPAETARAALVQRQLGHLHAITGDVAAARVALKAAVDGFAQVAAERRMARTPEQTEAVFDFLRMDEELIYSLVLLYPDDAELVTFAAEVAGARTGRDMEEAAAAYHSVRTTLAGDPRLERLDALQRKLGSLGFHAAASGGTSQAFTQVTTEHRALMAELGTEMNRRIGVGFELPTFLQVGFNNVLIEFVRFRRVDFTTHGAPHREAHYVAFVRNATSPVRAIPLGPADEVEQLVARALAAFSAPDREPVVAARALYDAIFTKLAPVLVDSNGEPPHALQIVPDGALHLVPFEALHDGRSYLIDRYTIHYLTSVREIVMRQRAEGVAKRTGSAIFAAPAFGVASSGGNDALSKLSRVEDLVGTRGEARAIAALLPDAVLYTDKAATESAVLASKPGILHVATHGAFLGRPPEGVAGTRGIGFTSQPPG
jgi:CHAT domain-containing protein